MSSTAARLGATPVRLDWSGLASITQHTPSEDRITQAWSRLKSRFESGEIGFYNSPQDNALSQLLETQTLARSLLDSRVFKHALFLGIGGSSLGPISLLQALAHQTSPNSPQIHFLENPDPITWSHTLKSLNPETTLVCAITKSGGTPETLAQFLLALEWLGKERWKSHTVTITDPEKGDLLAFSKSNGIRMLSIAPSIGGRFSIFTPVGLFAAELSGLSGSQFLKGALEIRNQIERTPPFKHPLFQIASHLLSIYPKHSVHVCMPYSTPLRSTAQWWVQLWGESLGKIGKGFSPIAAVGANDQHSILQLLRDGPNDKVTFFISLDSMGTPVKIPKGIGSGLSAFGMVQGHDLLTLLNTEQTCTARVLTNQSRPNWTLSLEDLSERSLGALYFTLATLTAFIGTLWEVNPFDQPGVEEGKIYLKESLEMIRVHQRNQATMDEDLHSAANRLRPNSD